jgi:hypothetical protein
VEACYIRGQAYLLLVQGRKAEAEFHEFLRRDVAVDSPFRAAAYLGLARAYRLQARAAKEGTLYLIGPPQGGNNDKARAAYEAFFSAHHRFRQAHGFEAKIGFYVGREPLPPPAGANPPPRGDISPPEERSSIPDGLDD